MDLDPTQDWTCALLHTEKRKVDIEWRSYSQSGCPGLRSISIQMVVMTEQWFTFIFVFYSCWRLAPHVSRSLFPLCMCVRSTLWGIFIHQMTSVSFTRWGKQALKCMSFSHASLNSCKCFCVWQRYELYLCLNQEKGTAESKEDASG